MEDTETDRFCECGAPIENDKDDWCTACLEEIEANTCSRCYGVGCDVCCGVVSEH